MTVRFGARSLPRPLETIQTLVKIRVCIKRVRNHFFLETRLIDQSIDRSMDHGVVSPTSPAPWFHLILRVEIPGRASGKATAVNMNHHAGHVRRSV